MQAEHTLRNSQNKNNKLIIMVNSPSLLEFYICFQMEIEVISPERAEDWQVLHLS